MKRAWLHKVGRRFNQPPSGGCVLKQKRREKFEEWRAAAFRRLCVET